MPVRSELKSTTLTFVKQTIVKQVLTEGEKFVMTIFDAVRFADQGVYDVVSNLSSLAARFLFAPIEETSYQMFCKYIDRGRRASDQEAGCLNQAQQLLCTLVRGVTLLGAMIFVFGFNFAQLSLLIYAGRDFAVASGASHLLRWQCLYVLIIAINGITESFTIACMNQRQLDSFNRILVTLSVLLTGSTLLLTPHFSSMGFVMANSLNMFCRILHSIRFITQYFRQSSAGNGFSVRSLFPDPVLVPVLVVMFIMLRGSEEMLCCTSYAATSCHVLFGASLLLSLLYLFYCRERKLVQFFARTLFTHSTQSTKRD